MEKRIVSIIIPAYNSEKYVGQCIDSLLAQTNQNFEIICVDDGSTDHTPDILEDYRKRDSRITVLTQNNLYAGAARNKGLEAAKGKYVLFLDSDDFFCKNMIEEIVYSAELYRAEVLVFDAYQFDDKKQKVINTTWKALRKELFGNGVKSALEIADSIFEFTVPSPWNKLFLREFILSHRIFFQSLKSTNDLYFVYASISYAEKIAILDKKLLYYRDNNTNSLQGTAGLTPMIFIEALLALKCNLSDRGIYFKYQKSFRTLVSQVCMHNLNKISDKKLYDKCRNKLKSELALCLGISEILISNDKGMHEIQNAIRNEETIIVYGAGEAAKTLLHFMLVFVQIKAERIKIVVTAKENNCSLLYGIPVLSFDESEMFDRNNLILIATSNKYLDEIASILKQKKYNRVFKMGFEELMKLLVSIV